jgi:molecular chaperone DnaJ
MNAGDDPYEILGVPPTASDREIRNAYRKASLRVHPDRVSTAAIGAGGDGASPSSAATVMTVEQANRKFAQLSAAYEILGDPEERQAYDRQQQQQQEQEQQQQNRADFFRSRVFHDPFEIFRSVFGSDNNNVGGGGGGVGGLMSGAMFTPAADPFFGGFGGGSNNFMMGGGGLGAPGLFGRTFDIGMPSVMGFGGLAGGMQQQLFSNFSGGSRFLPPHLVVAEDHSNRL